MGSFALYNYQFEKIAEHGRQLELEGFGKVVMTADEAFPDRQKIFGEMLLKDYHKATNDDIIHFKNEHGPKEYVHCHLMKPVDDIFIMRIANRKTQSYVDSNWKEKTIEDYQNCIVMIGNGQGLQRILIENKKSAFKDVKQVERIMEYTFNKLLARYSLKIRLEHLQNRHDFWQFAKDNVLYPDGFHKISIRLPYPNLDRLKKVYDRLLSQARESFDSRVDLGFVAPDGGKLRLDENDKYQSELMGWLMEDAGADVQLYSNSAKRTPIHVGDRSFRVVSISDATIRRVTEDSANGDLFGSTALDNVKAKLKTGIDPDA